MNFQDITTEVQKTLARTDTDITDRTGTWVNRRRHMAAARHNFGFMRADRTIAVVLNDQDYNFNANFKDDLVFYLEKTDSYTEIPIRSRVEMISAFSPTDIGEPAYVSLETWDNSTTPPSLTVLVWPPKPDASYTLKVLGFEWPADLSGTGHDWFTDHFPQMLIAGAVADGYWFLGAEEQVALWEARFETELQRAISHDVQRDFPRELTLEPRLGGARRGANLTSRSLWGL